MEENNNSKAAKEEESLVREYKKLLMKLHENEEDLLKPDNKQVTGYMEESQNLFSQIQSVKALNIDSKVVKKVSFIVKEKGHGMTSNIISFQVEEFAQKILQKMEVEPGSKTRRKSLVELGKRVSGKFQRSPSLGYLFGALPSHPQEREMKEARVRKPKEKATAELKETCSQDIKKDNVTSGEETDQLVSQALRALVKNYKGNGRQPLSFFQFILDPESFSKTIENMFHVSFLVKEGNVSIWVEEESGLPVIRPVKQASQKEEEVVENSQVVMNITMRHWKILARKYSGQNPMIP